MIRNEIKIYDIGIYDNYSQLSFSASNSQYCGTAEIYCPRIDFAKFAEELQIFPNSLSHTVTLEIGEDYKTYDYLLIKAFVEDSVGHSILFFIISNANIGRAEFKMNLEPASINEIGRKLALWISSDDIEFIWNG